MKNDVVTRSEITVTTKQLEFLNKVKHQKTKEPSECHEEEFMIRDVTFWILIQMKWYPGDKWERSHKDEYRSSTEYSTETPADFTIC